MFFHEQYDGGVISIYKYLISYDIMEKRVDGMDDF